MAYDCERQPMVAESEAQIERLIMVVLLRRYLSEGLPMRLRSFIRGVYTMLAVMVALVLLSGRDDPATNLLLSLASMLIIGLISWWAWLGERQRSE
ncbi:hypothetical protein [Herpetosiphon giganteus]|uniref:hypothetical protein n=1 Tax=Herpetosiphon giganteus TaxID=2029754 RepID=UPI0019588308|nr:hypothetical protein [Herpetosiphon giganteus]MBM7846676.1 drug/metabolite transporter (DMT)-like permease [Herpetosiphon giganteus]